MGDICLYVMLYTDGSLALTKQGHPTKKRYGLKAGLWKFAKRGNAAVMKELSKCFLPRVAHTLSRDECCNALTSLMFLTEKCSREVKTWACANDSVQHNHVAKEKATTPTVTFEAIFIQSTIFAHEHRDVATCDIPGAFLQADNPDYVLMRLDGILAELMVKVSPKLYCKFVTKNAKGKPVLYVQLKTAVYGMMKSALLFYQNSLLTSPPLVLRLIPMIHVLQIRLSKANRSPYAGMLMTFSVGTLKDGYVWKVPLPPSPTNTVFRAINIFIGHEDPTVVTHFINCLRNITTPRIRNWMLSAVINTTTLTWI